MPPPPDGGGPGGPPGGDGGTRPPPPDGGGPGGPPGPDGGGGPGGGGLDAGAGGGGGSDGGASSDAGTSVPAGIGTISGSGGIRAPFSGANVSIDSDTIVLGDTGSACYNGTASFYVWDSSSSSWTLQQSVTDPVPPGPFGPELDCFGGAVAVHGDTAFVGSPASSSFAGTVYEYTRSGTTWTQATNSLSNSSDEYFGQSLAYDGTYLAIGAPGSLNSGGSGTYYGVVEIFTANRQGNMMLEKTLYSPSPAASTCFGSALALDGTRLAVAADGAPQNTPEVNGAVYTYAASGSTWYFESGAVGNDITSADQFGASVALASGSPSLMVVGAPQASPIASKSGAAYVFYFSTASSTWVQNAKLFPPDGAAGDEFGYSVTALSSTEIAVGAPGANKVYLYANSGAGSAWTLTTTYQSCPVTVGTNLASSGNLIVTGKASDVVIDTTLANPGCGGN
jgi:hypothetical protein